MHLKFREVKGKVLLMSVNTEEGLKLEYTGNWYILASSSPIDRSKSKNFGGSLVRKVLWAFSFYGRQDNIQKY